MLDFYSCADCGRCSDNCPANAVGRPLSPRFISIKGRDLMFKNYPIYPYGSPFKKSEDLIGSIYEEDEIWSCTTCGACEQECPIGIEYIDKIVDLRRGMVDEGMVPQSLQKPLRAWKNAATPGAKWKRNGPTGPRTCPRCEVKDLAKANGRGPLLRGQHHQLRRPHAGHRPGHGEGSCPGPVRISVSWAKGERQRQRDPAIRRRDAFSDHEGDEHRCHPQQRRQAHHHRRPHAYNALKNDYQGLPPVEHISQFIARNVKSGAIRLNWQQRRRQGLHLSRPVLPGTPQRCLRGPAGGPGCHTGLKRVEMERCRDRSFCCGGGGLMLFYEPEEEQRMGVLRVEMAAKAGANVIVTACPFCLVNMEDAIKVAGLEGRWKPLICRNCPTHPVE
jgi:ferredoxin